MRKLIEPGAAALSELPALPPGEAAELKALLAEGEIALDVRAGEQFAAGHVPGSVNIALSGRFASWAGALLGFAAWPVLIAESPGSRRGSANEAGANRS